MTLNEAKERRYREIYGFYNRQIGSKRAKSIKVWTKYGTSYDTLIKIIKHFENENSPTIPANN